MRLRSINFFFKLVLKRLNRFFFVAVILFSALASRASSVGDWESGPGYRSKNLEIPPGGKPGFTLLNSNLTGIVFGNYVPEERHLTNQIILNGSGVAAGDVDGDGWCDLFFCGVGSSNRLYRNLGNWKFEDITGQAGVACAGLNSTGAAFADLDGDGDLELIVNSLGSGTRIFFNDGKGHFAEKAFLNDGKGGMTVAVADVDGDGYLDFYIANYRTNALMDMPNARATFKVIDGRTMIDRLDGRLSTDPELTNRFVVNASGRIIEMGQVDSFYRNFGGTNFVLVPFTGGAFLDEDGRPLKEPPFDWGLAAMFRDLNGDGLPDLYVCNDFDSVDRVWINQGQGRFRAIPRIALRKSSLFSMGVDFADINRDGFDDFLVLDMLNRDHRQRMTQMLDTNPPQLGIGEIENRPQYGLNTLFLNRGDGTFAEIGQLSGLDASEWSWTPVFLDVDLDGWEDVLISNGQERAARDLDVADQLKALRARKKMSDSEIFQARRIFPRLDTANLAFRNRGDLTFEEVGEKWGFNVRGISNGMALADLDNDGDLDVIVNNFNAPASIFRNNASASRIAIRLKGRPPNTRGIGAKVTVLGGAVPMQSQEIICGGRYLSCDEALRVFAAGTGTNSLTIEVKWRSGLISLVRNAMPNRVYEIDELGASVSAEIVGAGIPNSKQNSSIENLSSAPEKNPSNGITNSVPLFEDKSDLLKHNHTDEPFDDFARQPLLPNRLSQLGPGVAWFDVDVDGWDDLIVGSGKGGRLAIFRNNTKGGFVRLDGPPANLPVTRDQTSVLGWAKGPGQIVLLAGSANYEDGLAIGGCVRQFDLGKRVVGDFLPPRESSTGPLALGDVNSDGLLDLFVGGRVHPGKYPQPASSAIFRNVAGKLELDTENSKILSGVGLVSGAMFSDLNGDGFPELILACEWGPIRVFRNEKGKLIEATREFGLDQFKGWWNGVTTADLDGDGNLDIIATNWGQNSKYQRFREQALRLYFGDVDGDGNDDLIEAHFDSELKKFVPERQLVALGRVMPFLREKFPTNKIFAEAGVDELLGERAKAAKYLEANWLESTVFLNRGNHFEARALPVEAQFAPAFGVCVGDFDGDGNEDIFLAQNFFGAQVETPRYDAGRGLLLKGDGAGSFNAIDERESGIQIYGEQRGCAMADFDRDGRIDLVVTQNGAATKLYHNRAGRPGLRVQLKGPPGNPNAIGACLRLFSGTKGGPIHEIHSGSGYWSQDSCAVVLTSRLSPSKLWIRWPGGATSTVEIPQAARDVSIDLQGHLTVLHQ